MNIFNVLTAALLGFLIVSSSLWLYIGSGYEPAIWRRIVFFVHIMAVFTAIVAATKYGVYG